MIKRALESLLVIMVGIMTACSHASSSHSALDQPDSGWELIFSDDFSGSGVPDPEKWSSKEYNRKDNPEGPDGWWLRENVVLDGQGHLKILTRVVPNLNPEEDDDPFDYASGMATTEGRFEPVFGRYEARMKFPKDPGWWLAFWLFSDRVHNVDGSGEDGTEIDIVEGFGWTDELNFALHWDSYEEDHQTVFERSQFPGIRRGWHVFALEWSETEYIWFVDGKEVWRSNAGGVSKTPVWVKFSGEISTSPYVANKYWANKPVKRRFPDSFLVDWVRVYQREETPALTAKTEPSSRPPQDGAR